MRSACSCYPLTSRPKLNQMVLKKTLTKGKPMPKVDFCKNSDCLTFECALARIVVDNALT